MRPSKLRLPDRTDTTARSPCSTAAEISGDSGPELPMHVVQPYPTRLNPSSSRYSVSPARSRYSVTTFEPGASEVFTQGLTLSPFCTALRARIPAPSITDGFDVFVQLVIAAITTCPWSSSVSVPSASVTGVEVLTRSATWVRVGGVGFPLGSWPAPFGT